MNVTARLTLKLILANLKSQPFFLCTDDTMVSKFWKKFEGVSELLSYEHIKHKIQSNDTICLHFQI